MGTSNMAEPWNQGLFGCFDDCGGCVYGYFCYPCQYGQVSEKVYGQSCIVGALGAWCCGLCVCCCFGKARREMIRNKLNLTDEDCSDCMAWFCCAACANCQEYAELNHRRIETHDEFEHFGGSS